MKTFKVSIIVPVYNVEKYLNECVESMVNQDYKNLEIILVDDGSPDNSPQICDDWAKKDKRIKVIHKKNGGVSTARNAGLEIATGDYVTMLDSDDLFTSSFSKAIHAFDKDSDIVIVPINESEQVNKTLQINEENFKFLIKNSQISCSSSCSKFYKLNIIKNVRYSQGVTVGEDKEFVVKCLLKCNKVSILNLPFYTYRDNPDSCMNNKSFKLIMKLIDSTNKIFANIENYQCSDSLKEIIKEEFASNLYGAFRFYPNCTKEEKKVVIREIKNCFGILRLTKNKTKKLMLSIMKIFGVKFGLGFLNVLRKLKVVE